MRIETTINGRVIMTTVQESFPKDHSEKSKAMVRREREHSRIISVGPNAPIKHVKQIMEKYGITEEDLGGTKQ